MAALRRLAPVLVLFVLPGLAAGQSLGSAADKEKERLKKNEEAGVKARVVTDEELLASRPPPDPPLGTTAPDPAAPGAPARRPAPSKDSRRDDLGKPTAGAERGAAPDTGGPERMARARARLERAKRDYEEIEGRIAGPTPKPDRALTDDGGTLVALSPRQLQAFLAWTRIEMEVAQAVIDDLEAQGRRVHRGR